MSFHLHFTVWMKMHYLIWKKKDWLLFPNGKTHHRFNICNIATLQQMQYSCFHSNFVTSSFELSMMVMVVSILDRQPTRQSSCKYSCQFFSVLYWRSLSSPLSHLKFNWRVSDRPSQVSQSWNWKILYRVFCFWFWFISITIMENMHNITDYCVNTPQPWTTHL